MIRDFPLPAPPAGPGRSPSAGRPPSPGRSTSGRGPSDEVPVRDAATVMLVRDGAQGVEVFLFRRVASMVFAAGMHVFPGGRVDTSDGDPDVPWEGPEPARFAEAFSTTEDGARALVVAAVRETFEECGVLLAAPPGGGPVVGLPGGWQEHRDAVLDQRASLGDVLRGTGLALRADLLTPWARWVTPPGEPRRYDTRFLVAQMPPEQEAHDLGGEGEHAQWVPAAEALRRWRAGETAMLPPTVVCVEDLAAAPDVATLRATPRAITPVMPWAEPAVDGGLVVRVALDGRGGGSFGVLPGAGTDEADRSAAPAAGP